MLCEYYRNNPYSFCLRPQWDEKDSPYCEKHTPRYIDRVLKKEKASAT